MGKMIIIHSRDYSEILVDPTACIFLQDGVHSRMYDGVFDILEDQGVDIDESIEQIRNLVNGQI